jgi:coenzyme F420-reducing hydrogenase beta subunit
MQRKKICGKCCLLCTYVRLVFVNQKASITHDQLDKFLKKRIVTFHQEKSRFLCFLK